MAKTGRAAVWKGAHSKFDIREYPLPDLEPGAILVKIAMTNICGTELHLYRGDIDVRKLGVKPRESIGGHEMSGRVYALGKDKKTDSLGRPLKEGDRIIYQYFQPCGQCYYCLTNASNSCPNFMRRYTLGQWPYFTGGFAEYYYMTPGRQAFKVMDDRIPDSLLASVNCAFSEVAQGLHRINLRPGQSIVLQGVG
ncbi:MAG: alcohol dehydrogenase catalytic domain-containing protein, partial [Chloroflexi bacterium]|nr:alcohol dehydrogenase catalytic domain-containing protein [Chloroflexota bacterium]